MTNKISTKLSIENKDFLKRLGINEAYLNKKTEILTPSEALDKIEKYFKNNNPQYLNMLGTKAK